MMYSNSFSTRNHTNGLENHNDIFADYPQVQQTQKQSEPFLSISSPSETSCFNISPVPSMSSLQSNNSPTSTMSSFIKIPSPKQKINELSQSDDRFLMTLIQSPSMSPQPSSSLTDNFSTSDESAGTFFKNKMAAVLNHVKYQWGAKMRPNFRINQSPIYCLGKMYDGVEQTIYDDSYSGQNRQEFVQCVSSRIYFSYRKSFKPLKTSKIGDTITTDGGWGCMIRCAQMLLAQALLLQWTTTNQINLSARLGDSAGRRNSIGSSRSLSKHEIYTRIIRLFGDFPDVECPFGIHKIVELGVGHGIRVGEFFGPSSAAHCLKEAMEIAVENQLYSDTLNIYISRDAIVYRQDVYNLFTDKKSSNQKSIYPSLTSCQSENNEVLLNPRSVLILIPLRLGLNELDVVYEEYLKEALRLPQTVGIIGGSPRHAVYIIGFQDNSFINLDPHLIQNAVNVLSPSFDLSTYSCSSPRTLTAKKMDPSCTLGFYCRDKADFEMFCAQWNKICHLAPDNRRDCPMFRIEPGTFEENQNLLFNTKYPSFNDDTSLIVRITKVQDSNGSLSLTDRLQSIKSNIINSNSSMNRESWDDADRSLTDQQYSHARSISEDYVYL